MNLKMSLVVAAAALSTAHAAAAVDGKALFASNCAGCHGAKAQGQVGPSLKDAATWKYDLFKRAVLNGVDDQGKALKPPMPHFAQTGFGGKKPTDAQLKALQTFVKTVTK